MKDQQQTTSTKCRQCGVDHAARRAAKMAAIIASLPKGAF